MSFNKFGFSKEILKAISDQGYNTPTPIQNKAIPVILNRQDVLGSAQTGTGKTAGFTLPLLQRLMDITHNVEGKRRVRALILTPTRELAVQVEESVQTYGKHLPLISTVVYGGVSIKPQIKAIRKGVDILVATPGRLLDHLKQKIVSLEKVDMFVLDEADRMLDMGFIHDIRKIMDLIPKKRQSLLFSATISKEIKHLADRLLNSPVLIEVARRNTPSEIVKQIVYMVDKIKKAELLYDLIVTGKWEQVLVFTRTKHGADKLTKKLKRDDISAIAIHGNKSQGARTKALSQFKNGGVRVLVATDVAARGLDIDQLPHVVNFELPNISEDYVHRIGRTGRAGNVGEAISLVCVDELKFLKDIERLIKREIPKNVIPGFEPDPKIKPNPVKLGLSSAGKGTYTRNKGRVTQFKKRDDNILTRTRTSAGGRSKTNTNRKKSTLDRAGKNSRTNSGNIKTAFDASNKRKGSSFKSKAASKRRFTKPRVR